VEFPHRTAVVRNKVHYSQLPTARLRHSNVETAFGLIRTPMPDVQIDVHILNLTGATSLAARPCGILPILESGSQSGCQPVYPFATPRRKPHGSAFFDSVPTFHRGAK